MTTKDDRQAAAARKRLAAQVRAVENPRLARVQPDGSIVIKSEREPGVRYRVTYYAAPYVIVFKCTCPAGERGTFCKHAARAGLRLERERLADYVPATGQWIATEKARVLARAAERRSPRRAEILEAPFSRG